MAIKYTKAETLSMAEEAVKSMSTFYQQGFVNYTGTVLHENDYYSEVIAAFLLERLELFENIPTIRRKGSYCVQGHDGVAQNPGSNQKEAHLAYDLFRKKNVPGLGRVLDYQVPLKDVQADEAGKIDLVAEDGSSFYLLELKQEDNHKETLLRCVLEILTYWHTVDQPKLLEDFKDSLDSDIQPPVVPAVLLPEGCTAYRELTELRAGKRPNLAKLMETKGVQAFVLDAALNCRRG